MGLHKQKEDQWVVKDWVEGPGGIIGTLFWHLYTAGWDDTPTSLGLTPGAAMPNVSGYTGAFIISVVKGEQRGTSSREYEVVGFCPMEQT